MFSFTKFILEQAKTKSKIKDRYETISLVVFDHLLKSLVYEDKDNTEKHLREMSDILRRIQSVKSRSSYIDKEKLKQILFDDYKDLDFKKYIEDKDIDYGNLQKRNLTKREIFNILEKVYSRLSSELSKQSFKTLLEYPEFKQFLIWLRGTKMEMKKRFNDGITVQFEKHCSDRADVRDFVDRVRDENPNIVFFRKEEIPFSAGEVILVTITGRYDYKNTSSKPKKKQSKKEMKWKSGLLT